MVDGFGRVLVQGGTDGGVADEPVIRFLEGNGDRRPGNGARQVAGEGGGEVGVAGVAQVEAGFAQACAVAPDEGKVVGGGVLVKDVCRGQAPYAPAGEAVVVDDESTAVEAEGFAAAEVAYFAAGGVAAVSEEQRAEEAVFAVGCRDAASEEAGEDSGRAEGEQGRAAAGREGEGHGVDSIRAGQARASGCDVGGFTAPSRLRFRSARHAAGRARLLRRVPGRAR